MELADQFKVLALCQRWERLATEITDKSVTKEDSSRDEIIESYNKANTMRSCAAELRNLLVDMRKR
jgi:hypothetical protein